MPKYFFYFQTWQKLNIDSCFICMCTCLKKTVGDFKLELYQNLIERWVSGEIQKIKSIGRKTNVLSNKWKIYVF